MQYYASPEKKKKTSFVVESAWIKQIYNFATWFEERLCKLSTRNYKIHHIVKFVSKIEYTVQNLKRTI